MRSFQMYRSQQGALDRYIRLLYGSDAGKLRRVGWPEYTRQAFHCPVLLPCSTAWLAEGSVAAEYPISLYLASRYCALWDSVWR